MSIQGTGRYAVEGGPPRKKRELPQMKLIAWVQDNPGTLARMRAQQPERIPKLPPHLPDGFPTILSQRGAAGPEVAARPLPPGWTACPAPRWEVAASPRSRLRGRRNLRRACLAPCWEAAAGTRSGLRGRRDLRRRSGYFH